MKLTRCTSLFFALLLGGCTGTSSEFQCNSTTNDRCMTMEQANDLARSKTEGPRGKPGARALPTLVDLPSPVITPQPQPTPPASLPTAPRAHQAMPASPSPVKPGKQASFIPDKTNAAPLLTDALCSAPRCDTPGEATPLRLTDTIATLWIAPWIDDKDVFHQPGRVSFVLLPGTWQLPQQLN